MLQFVNVKIYLFGITALTGYVTDYSTSLGVLVLFELVIATVGTAATLVWIGVGTAARRRRAPNCGPFGVAEGYGCFMTHDSALTFLPISCDNGMQTERNT